MSLQRLDRSVEAEPLLEQLVLKKDSEYMSRGMSRLRLMLGGKAHDAALAGLLARPSLLDFYKNYFL